MFDDLQPRSSASVMTLARVMPVSSDAAACGVIDDAVANQEQVLARALADRAVGRQRDAFVEAAIARLEADERAGQVVAAGFRQRRNRIRRDALPRRDAAVDAVLERLGAEVRAPFPGRDRYVDRMVGFRREADVAVAAKRDRADVCAVGQIVCQHDLTARAVDFRRGERNLDPMNLRRLEQTTRVRLQPKNLRPVRRRVNADPFEHGRAVVQRMRHHVHLRLGPVHEFAVMPDPFVFVYRHCRPLLIPRPHRPGLIVLNCRTLSAGGSSAPAPAATRRQSRLMTSRYARAPASTISVLIPLPR